MSPLGGEIWRVQTRQGESFSEFDSGEKDVILMGVERTPADIKLLLDPQSHRLLPWPDDATRHTLDQWVKQPLDWG